MAYKPWRFISREVAAQKRAKDVKNAFRKVDDSAREAGSSFKKSARQIAEEADDEIAGGLKSGFKKTMTAFDAAGEYVGRPLAAVYTGQLTEERKMGADGQYYRDAPELIEGPRSWRKALTQNPVDTYKQAREASHERYRDPALQKDIAGRIALSTASDPLTIVPGGTVAKVLPRGLAATKGARVATELIETPRRVVAGSAAGAAAGEYVAEKAGAPGWVGGLAGGIAGGGLAARRPTATTGARVSKMVDYQHPESGAYTDALTRHGVDFSYDENGVIVPDPDQLDRVIGELTTKANVSLEPRGVYEKKAPYVEVGGKQVRASRKRLGTEEPDPDTESIADLQRLRELISDDVPPPDVEATRMERVRQEVDDALPKAKELTERQKKLRETAATKEAATKAENARVASLPYRAPKMQKDGAWTIVYKTDRTSERFYAPKGTRGEKGLARAKALYEAEEAKYTELSKPVEAPKTDTVKRTDIFGNVTDTFQTEAELQGIRAEQGGLDMGGRAAAWESASKADEVRQPATPARVSKSEPISLIEAPTIKENLNRGGLDLRLKSDPTGASTTARPRGPDADFAEAPPLIPTSANSSLVPPEGIGPGNPQPALGQEKVGADLLQLPDRDRAIAGESAFMQSRAGKLDNALRSSTAKILTPLLTRGGSGGRAANIIRDERITPIFRGINQAENQRSHIKALVEDKLHALRGSGLKVVQSEDGNWVEANSGVPWSDIVEQDTDAGRAAWSALTDDQRKLTTELTDLQVRGTETLQRYGGDISLLTHEGEHWPRRVASIAGEDKARGMNSSKRIGAERGFNKARSVDSAAGGADRQIVYEHPFDAYTTALDEKLRSATDAWVTGMVEPLAKKGTGSFATLNLPGNPGLAGLNFDPADANRLQAGLAGDQHGAIEGFARGVNSYVTPFRASLDFSATFQQGMKMWLDNPKAAARLWKDTLASLKNPDRYYAAREEIVSDITRMLDEAGIDHQGGLEYLITNGLRQTAEKADHEFALPRIPEGRLEKAGVAKKAYNKAADKSQEHFDRLLNLYRVESSRDVMKQLIDRGLTGDQLATELRKGTRAINRAFGWSESKPSSIEAIGMFAPRFFRSNIETLYQAVTDKSIEGEMARDHLMRLAATGVALTFAANEARGYETVIDPRDSNFMRIRNVGGVDVSPFGPYDTLVRYVASGVTGNPGSFGKLAEAKASPIVGQALAQVKGKTYLGEPLDSKAKRVTEAFKNLTPFPVQNIIEQGIEEKSPKDALVSGIVSAFGAKNSPVTPSERAKFLQSGHRGLTGAVKVAGEAQNRFGKAYDDLTGAEKAQVNEKPEIARALANSDRRASKGDSDRAESTRIQQTVRDEVDASAKFLAAGKDESGATYSGNDFRLAYNDTQMRAAGARAQIKQGGGDAEVNGWFALYDQAKMANGQPDYDKLERLQGEYRTKHPGIDAKVDKTVGVRDNAAVRELRAARKEAAAYYQIPRFKGMTLEEGEAAGEILKIAADMVKFGEARNRGHAFRLLKESGREAEVTLAKKALRRKSNPERADFRKNNALFAKYYSDAGAA